MGGAAAADLLRDGREALARGEWERAAERFERAREREESPEALDGLSQAAHFRGRYAEAIELKERAFAAYRARGRRAEAAEVARWLAFLHGLAHGNMAAARGWLGRAEGLLGGLEPCATHGWLALDRAALTGDAAARERLAEEAVAIARRVGDAELEFAALALLGNAYVARGRIEEGMSLLDQAMAAVAAREVVAVGAVGDIYCRLLGACERATDVRRAEQWIAATDRLVAWGDFVAPVCRCHYGGILIAVGRWEEAERELLAALRAFEHGYRGARTDALFRLADLRLRQGRFEEAELLLEGLDWHGAGRRTLAAVARARGDPGLAEHLVRLCLLRALGEPAGRGRPRGNASLSPREQEVLGLLGHGLSNAEIAARLYISRRTVEPHVTRVLAKLGLRRRSEAAAHALRSRERDPHGMGNPTDAPPEPRRDPPRIGSHRATRRHGRRR